MFSAVSDTKAEKEPSLVLRDVNLSIAGGIVLLDEVSSGVDHETEMLMLRIIHSEFASYTIISIAHRLDMVVKFSDTVVVLGHGEVKEVGTPDELLNRTGGHFKALWDSGRQ
jgi:ATP-binding cassette, subfamily C (CFTR/MRP), member 1